jgi:hypothetical protein
MDFKKPAVLMRGSGFFTFRAVWNGVDAPGDLRAAWHDESA